MTLSDENAVFTDGISRVELVAAGPPALGFPTRIKVSTGPFRAEVEAEAWDYQSFRNDVLLVHETLTGKAELTFVEGGHSIRLIGNGRGDVEVVAVVGDGRSPCQAYLTIRLNLDQSHLPNLIHAIRREFL